MKTKLISKKNCIECRFRKARFRFNGVVKWDKDHKLCFKCYRAQANRLREIIRAEASARVSAVCLGNFGFAGN